LNQLCRTPEEAQGLPRTLRRWRLESRQINMTTIKRTYGKKNKVLGRYLVDSIHSAEPSSFDKVQSWKRFNQDEQVFTNLSSVRHGKAEGAFLTSLSTGESQINPGTKSFQVNPATNVTSNTGDGLKPSAPARTMSTASRSTSKIGTLHANKLPRNTNKSNYQDAIQLKRLRSEVEASSNENVVFQTQTLPNSSKLSILKTEELHNEPSMNLSTNEVRVNPGVYGTKDSHQALAGCYGSYDYINIGRAAASPKTLPSKHCQVPLENAYGFSSDLSNTAIAGAQPKASSDTKRSAVSETANKKKIKKVRPSYPSLPLCSLQCLFKHPR